ncbi:hypothetical protein CYMTET_39892 [Cymbomonas tetramitiformis]|uniref:Uncharacterized protein n=1 Tax=Cymbomonas tetramitiformis TaxID=36881 RepID=A0AAE0F482_9CHLO|nr:hypothetical protein CYMTET_39892 [Cymbomonas tetramitiformis]
MHLARALEEVPHAFGDNLDGARDCTAEIFDSNAAFLRGSVVIWHAHLHEKDAGTEAKTPNNDTIGAQKAGGTRSQ